MLRVMLGRQYIHFAALVLVLILAAALLVFFSFHLGFLTAQPRSIARYGPPDKKANLTRSRDYWSDRMKKVGSQLAYDEFKNEYRDRHFEDQHTAAHIFGELLYKKDGVGGFTVCDEVFSFGCYHGFFSPALSGEGIGRVEGFNKECIKKIGIGTACQHGIGHGLMEYFGRKNLLAALGMCEKIQHNPLNGCSAGVFMEYNITAIFADDNARVNIRALNPDNPRYPCDTLVSEHFRPSCYFEIGLWWKQVFGSDFKKIGGLCQPIEAASEREACYMGLGKVAAPSANYGIPLTINYCKSINNSRGELYCRVGAALVFLAMENHKHLAIELCRGMESTFESRCRELTTQL